MNLSALHKTAFSLMQLKRYEEAAEIFSRVLELDPGRREEAKFYLGIASFESGQYDKALSVFEEINEEDQKNSSALYWKGLVLIRQEAYEKALEVFSRLIEQNPLFTEAWYLRGISHSKLKQHEDASQGFQ